MAVHYVNDMSEAFQLTTSDLVSCRPIKLQYIIREMLAEDPEQRPTSEYVVQFCHDHGTPSDRKPVLNNSILRKRRSTTDVGCRILFPFAARICVGHKLFALFDTQLYKFMLQSGAVNGNGSPPIRSSSTRRLVSPSRHEADSPEQSCPSFFHPQPSESPDFDRVFRRNWPAHIFGIDSSAGSMDDMSTATDSTEGVPLELSY